MRKHRFHSLIIGTGCILLSLSSFGADSSGSNLASPPVAGASAGTDDTLRAYLQLQEQIHETQLAVEQGRLRAEEAAARNSKALADRLQAIEQSLSAQRTWELTDSQRAAQLDSVQRANRTLVAIVSIFAALGCLAVLLAAYFQWRVINRFAAASTALHHAFPWTSVEALPGADGRRALGPWEGTDALLGAMDRLEKRIKGLEQTPQALTNGAPEPVNGAHASAPEAAPAVTEEKLAQVTSLLGKGQSLLNLEKAEEAVTCFDDVLAIDPKHTEALIKKGTALERMRKHEEALACYDRAIAADGSLTIAYLYKGGLYNRMERFTEAVQCYEQALHTQEAHGAARG